MYEEPLFLAPVFKERIWGGTKLKEQFGYPIPSDKTGECWGISAHPHGPSMIKNGVLKGMTLDKAWKRHRELFGNFESETFPLLTKILDASTDLSVQVHPDDEYAQDIESEPFGKTECWYVIDCEEDAEIVYGHHAESKEALRNFIENGQWSKLLRRVRVRPGDFFYVPSGTIHAIGGGIMILETQQSSDITYRVYDYDRPDSKGRMRELHVEPSIAVTTVPHKDPILEYKVKQEEQAVFTQLVEDKYFTVENWEIRGHTSYNTLDKPFMLFSVLEGEGEIVVNGRSIPVWKNDHFIMPSTIKEFQINGYCKMIVSYP